MNKTELIAKVADLANEGKATTERVIDALGIVITDALIGGGEITLPGIGKLTVKAKAARTGRNPATGESIEIPAKNVPHFSAAKALKDAVA